STNPCWVPGSAEPVGNALPRGAPPLPGSMSIATSRTPSVTNAKTDAVWLEEVPRPTTFLRVFATDQISWSSSSSRSALAEAKRASLRCSDEQYCRSTIVRNQPISLPHKKHIIEDAQPNLTARF